MRTLFLSLICGGILSAQGLSLTQAVTLALQQNKSLESAHALVKAAEAHTQSAKAGFWPSLNYAESATRSNNPVFVFSSLLTEHQFGAANFELGPLNRPNSLDNFRSALTAQETVFDAGQTKNAIRAGKPCSKWRPAMFAARNRKSRSMTVRAYLDTVLSEAALKAARESVKSAEADLERAQNVRQAGMSTDADVLSIRVHLAYMKRNKSAAMRNWPRLARL